MVVLWKSTNKEDMITFMYNIGKVTTEILELELYICQCIYVNIAYLDMWL